MGDWSILGRFLTEVQNHSTVIGKIWLTMLLIFRILLVTLVGDAVYSDEQSKFICNSLQPGCNNVCYDTFAPVSHLRFWVFQIVLVSTPSIFYIIYVLHKIAKDEKLDVEKAQGLAQQIPLGDRAGQVRPEDEGASDVTCEFEEGSGLQGESAGHEYMKKDFGELGKDPRQLSSQVLFIYILHVVLRSVMEVTFLVGQVYLFGFEVPHLFHCETYPCPNRTDCFVSRATEKTIFLIFMFSVSLGCFILNILELHYLGWVYIFRVLCLACSTCCESGGDAKQLLRLSSNHNPLLLELKHSLQGSVFLEVPAAASQEKSRGAAAHLPAISFETDCTLEHSKAKLSNGKKSWL
ncbi:gap junction delta-2 protein-like [Denticeps clupeoides]|uniref:Uncharacterized protein n=1 Tax=Denticeps clupeoides TaxID=299321 RepID=A0AAY4D030_9TELE|nr:gap junction delta-2 protein-like [Denticeps clupeoides]